MKDLFPEFFAFLYLLSYNHYATLSLITQSMYLDFSFEKGILKIRSADPTKLMASVDFCLDTKNLLFKVELMSLLIFVMPGMFAKKKDQLKKMFSLFPKNQDESER